MKRKKRFLGAICLGLLMFFVGNLFPQSLTTDNTASYGHESKIFAYVENLVLDGIPTELKALAQTAEAPAFGKTSTRNKEAVSKTGSSGAAAASARSAGSYAAGGTSAAANAKETADANGTSDANGNANVNGTSDAGGTANVNGTSDANGTANVNGTSDADGTTNVNGTSDAGGTANVNGTSDADGTANANETDSENKTADADENVNANEASASDDSETNADESETDIANDPEYEHITSISPIIVEETRFMLLAAAAIKKTGTLSKSTCVSFDKYTSGKWHCYRYLSTGDHNYYHQYYTTRISYHMLDSTYAYCIEPNTVSKDDISYTGYSDDAAGSKSYWLMELDAKQRTYIKKILAVGYPNASYGCGKKAAYAATQTLIWEVVSKCRYSSLATTKDNGLYEKILAVLGDDYKNAYKKIVNSASNDFSDGTVPSFAAKKKSAAKTITLKLNEKTECYEATVKDTNKVLSHFPAHDSKADITYAGNSLKISVPVDLAASLKNTVVKLESDLLDPDSADADIWENPTYQTVITQGSATNMKAYFKLTWEDAGAVELRKMAVNPITGEVKPETGAVFRMWKKSAGSYKDADAAERTKITIGSDGVGDSSYMPLGTYCICQYSGWDGYEPLGETIEVNLTKAGERISVDSDNNPLDFEDRMWTGTIEILKIDGDTKKPLSGAVFELEGSDGSRRAAETDESGKLLFDELYYGVTYSWKEIKAPEGYEISADAFGSWSVDEKDAYLQEVCENFKEKYGSISVMKTDHNQKALAGCTFLLEYKDNGVWKPVLSRSSDGILAGRSTNQSIEDGCLTTGKSGKVTFTGLWVDGMEYRLTEIAAPAGYELLSDPVIFEGTLPLKTALADVKADYVKKTSDEEDEDFLYSYDLSFTIKDQSQFTLPMTGESGRPDLMSAIFLGGFFLGLLLLLSLLRIKPVGQSDTFTN